MNEYGNSIIDDRIRLFHFLFAFFSFFLVAADRSRNIQFWWVADSDIVDPYVTYEKNVDFTYRRRVAHLFHLLGALHALLFAWTGIRFPEWEDAK